MFDDKEAWRAFVAEEKASDDKTEVTSLLALEPKRVWGEEDLDTQKDLELGLYLLYNLSRWARSFHRTHSIHINYTDLPHTPFWMCSYGGS
ncbi:hypothetical protein N7540_002115 [Penicillium herquei]|nr:hypothetical protein N7540_002115 [Penicillium herquei]